MAAILSGGTRVDLEIVIPLEVVVSIDIRFMDKVSSIKHTTSIPIRAEGSTESLNGRIIQLLVVGGNASDENLPIHFRLQESGVVVDETYLTVPAGVDHLYEPTMFILTER